MTGQQVMRARVAVVGHVEWIDFAVVPRLPVPGEILHVPDFWGEAAGGGAVAAVQMAKLAGSALFLTALAEDDHGARTRTQLVQQGVTVHAGVRDGEQRRGFTYLTDDGERTITVLGERPVPHGDDPLPWEELDAIDGVYVTGADAGALQAARRARTVVATPRTGPALLESGIRLDVLVRSGSDAGEDLDPAAIDPPPRTVVTTLGGKGGRWDGEAGIRHLGAAAPARAARRRLWRGRLVRRRAHHRARRGARHGRRGPARRALRSGEHDRPRPLRRPARPASVTPLQLGAEEVARLLEPAALLDALADAFAAAARGEVVAPPRSALELDARRGLLVMPGRRAGGPVIVKHVGLYADNPARGLPAHPATICAFDADTGALLAVLDATRLTATRTAGAAALSIRLAARPGSRVAAVIGAGPVAEAHLELLPAVLPGAELRVTARDPGRAAALAATHDAVAMTAEAAVRGADVICLCTSAARPVLARDAVAPGTHVTSVGFNPPGGELDPELARTARLLVETRDAFAPPPAGCAELVGLDPAAAAELGEVLLGTRTAREHDDEITVFKSMGTVIEDLAAAEVVLRAATS